MWKWTITGPTDEALCPLFLSCVSVVLPWQACAPAGGSCALLQTDHFCSPSCGKDSLPLPARICTHSPRHDRRSFLRRRPQHFIPISVHLLCMSVRIYSYLHDNLSYYKWPLLLRAFTCAVVYALGEGVSSFNFWSQTQCLARRKCQEVCWPQNYKR